MLLRVVTSNYITILS